MLKNFVAGVTQRKLNTQNKIIINNELKGNVLYSLETPTDKNILT